MAEGRTGSDEVDERLATWDDWRGELLARARELIHQAVPDVVEAVKWRKPSNPGGVAVWEYHGMLCTGEVYKDKAKLTFPRGSEVEDPTGIFNASLNGVRRAIDLHEGDTLDDDAFIALVRGAAAVNEG